MLNALELKVPPVALTIIFAVMMWFISAYQPALAFSLPWSAAVAVVFVSVGIVISLAGVVAFRRAKTTVNPIKPETTTAIVTSGVYGVSRNPMYLGFILALAGWATFLAHLLAFALLPLFVWYMNRFQIVPEERALCARFSHVFTAYKCSVRRWL